jgi:hypothetical protein
VAEPAPRAGRPKADESSAGLDAAVRAANVERARAGVLKRPFRQDMGIGAGLGAGGGSSDIRRPVADALTRAVRAGKEHYVIPTQLGMQASSCKDPNSGYILVAPNGEVSQWERPDMRKPHRRTAVMPDHAVRAILDSQLSKTRKYTPPAAPPKTAAKDPDVYPRAVVARLVRDIQKIPGLQQPQYYQRARDVAAKSGALDLIPSEWNTAGAAAPATGEGADRG